MPNLTKLSRSAALAAVLLTTAALAATLTTGAFSGAAASSRHVASASSAGQQQPESATPHGGIGNVPAAVISDFEAFRRAPTAEDSVIATESAVLGILYRAQQASGVNPSLARVIYQGAATTLALVPGSNAICLVDTSSPSALCESTARAASHNFGIVSQVGSPQGVSITVSGVVPDGVRDVYLTTSGGARMPVAVSSDGGYSVTPASEPTAIVYTDGRGARHSEPVAPSLPAPTAP
jgi:hypothetical protein